MHTYLVKFVKKGVIITYIFLTTYISTILKLFWSFLHLSFEITYLVTSKQRLMFHQILWSSQNIWTLCTKSWPTFLYSSISGLPKSQFVKTAFLRLVSFRFNKSLLANFFSFFKTYFFSILLEFGARIWCSWPMILKPNFKHKVWSFILDIVAAHLRPALC